MKNLQIDRIERGADGVSAKVIWRTRDDQIFETGYFRFPGYDTVCVSSQIGCNVGCRFCITGLMPVVRNLNAAEIVEQAMADPADMFTPGARLKVSFQGMGEPFQNLKHVVSAIKNLRAMRPDADIGVSTVGFASHLSKLAEEAPRVKLQISLHSLDEQTRGQLIPLAATHSLETLLVAARNYARTNERAVVLNYMLLSGQNDRFEDGVRFGRLASADFELKLSEYNASSLLPFMPASPERAAEFVRGVRSTGSDVYRFESLGTDIDSGCGHLRSRVDGDACER